MDDLINEEKLRKNRIMIITEQPKSLDTNKHENCLISDIEDCKECESLGYCGEIEKPAICLEIKYEMLEKDFKNISVRFKTILKEIIEIIGKNYPYYWTHYIKHHTKDTGFSKKDENRKNNKNWGKIGRTCSKKWFKREIEKFEPSHIIVFGGEALKGIRGSLNIKEDWAKQSITELSREPIFYSIEVENKKIKIMPLTHPSGRNPYANDLYGTKTYTEFFEKFKNEFYKSCSS